MNNRRVWVCGVFAASVSAIATFAQNETTQQTPPNVLFIGFDDLRPLLGCYGDPIAKTPNLDRFAAKALRFSRAHVQQAVCAASRASLLTGCRPDTTGADYPYSEYFVNEFLSSHPSLMTRFMQAGYFSQTFGKIHHGFDEPLSAPNFDDWEKNRYILPENKNRPNKDCEPFEHPDVPDNAYADGEIADYTVAALREHVARKSDQPFFFATGFYKPHLPWSCPKKYYDLYRTEEMPLAAVKSLPENGVPWSRAHFALNHYAGPKDSDDEIIPDARARELIHSYYACVSYADAQFGRVMDEVERLGLLDNTIILMWSDHGWHLGEQGMWGKSANFYLDTHVPLMIHVPGMQTGGQVCDALVESVDMYPTLTELAAIGKPAYLEGTSFAPLVSAPNRVWKSAVFSQFPRWHQSIGHVEGFVVQTDRYRYIEWRRREKGGPIGVTVGCELYDHKNDSIESRNIAGLPENRILLERLSKKLSEGWKNALPPGVTTRAENPPAPPAIEWR